MIPRRFMMVLRNKLTKQLFAGLTIFALSIAISYFARPRLFWGAVYTILTLIPVFPAIFVGFIVVSMIAGLDELQRKIQLNALAFSMATTVLMLFAIGLLGEDVSPILVLIAIALFWAFGWVVTRRRYL
jgi:ABC-type multidrug transport system permease subunit